MSFADIQKRVMANLFANDSFFIFLKTLLILSRYI